MKHDVTLYSAIAMATIVTLLLLAYRSPLVLLLTMVPVVSGALAGWRRSGSASASSTASPSASA